VYFALLGSALVKVAHKTLVKLTAEKFPLQIVKEQNTKNADSSIHRLTENSSSARKIINAYTFFGS